MEEAAVEWEEPERVGAVEDAVGFFVHAMRGQEEREARSYTAVVCGVEVDRFGDGDNEVELVDAHAKLAGEVEEAEGLLRLS